MSSLQAAQQAEAPMSIGRHLFLLTIWLFPYLLAAGAFLIAEFYAPAAVLKASALKLPVPQDVYGWLLLMVLIAGTWLISEFISVTSRETVVTALQLDAAFSAITALLFTGAAGWMIGTDRLAWWFIVPWIATIIDALTAAWLGINNAAQKPFLSKKGTT
jgi:hypothetical protein